MIDAPAFSPSALRPWPIPSPTNTFGSQRPDQSGSFANAATRGGSCGAGGPEHADEQSRRTARRDDER